MTQYEVEVDYSGSRERVERKTYSVPIILRYFEDGKLIAEIRAREGSVP